MIADTPICCVLLNSAFGLVVMCEHWTPKGDCKVTGHKESQFYERNPFKKSSPSIPKKIIWNKKKLTLKFLHKSLKNRIGPKKKFTKKLKSLSILNEKSL